MEKCFLLISSLFLLTGCANSQNDVSAQVYHEIETVFTNQIIDDGDFSAKTAEEIRRLQEKGEVFWYDQSRKVSARTSMHYLQSGFECKGGIKVDGNCSIDRLQANQNNIPPGFKIDKDKCDDGWCLIIAPEFPKVLANKIKQLSGFYGLGQDIYTVGSMKNDDNYSIFKNEKEIFSSNMFFGADSVIEDAGIVLNLPVFTFYDLKGWNEKDEPIVKRNIWYNGETLNEKYGIDASFYLFSFKDKIGFVEEKNGKKFFFFNGQKISQDFDEIRTHACCAVMAYPVEIDENGILFFLAKRGEKYFFVEVNLNEYLD